MADYPLVPPQPGKKLRYKILGRRPLTVSGQPSGESMRRGAVPMQDQGIDMVDVEWTHDDGFPPDTQEISLRSSDLDLAFKILLEKALAKKAINDTTADALRGVMKENFTPHDRNPNATIVTIPIGTRKVIADQINVPGGTPDHMVISQLEDKRDILATALKISK